MNIVDLCDDILGKVAEEVAKKQKHRRLMGEMVVESNKWHKYQDKRDQPWEECCILDTFDLNTLQTYLDGRGNVYSEFGCGYFPANMPELRRF